MQARFRADGLVVNGLRNVRYRNPLSILHPAKSPGRVVGIDNPSERDR